MIGKVTASSEKALHQRGSTEERNLYRSSITSIGSLLKRRIGDRRYKASNGEETPLEVNDWSLLQQDSLPDSAKTSFRYRLKI